MENTTRYAVLANPGHNRVYFGASGKLSLSELELACSRFGVSCGDIDKTIIGGIPYFTFTAAGTLGGDDLAMLSRLSFVYAVFMLRDMDGSPALLPLEKSVPKYFDDSVSSILKYTGKTNEIFTRLMINIAAMSGKSDICGRLRLLDPVAGKGTTLFEGLMAGYDVYGIEIGTKIVQEAASYFKKYLETEKYKHTFKKERFSGENRSFTSEIYSYEFARSKEDMKNDEDIRSLTFVSGNSMYADKYFKKDYFDIIVGDLPYGVQHGNVTNEKQSSLTRNPKELLSACMPAWRRVLTPGGAVVLAWNKLVLSRDEMIKVFEANGLSVCSGGVYEGFEHRVDQSINRDIVVALKV